MLKNLFKKHLLNEQIVSRWVLAGATWSAIASSSANAAKVGEYCSSNPPWIVFCDSGLMCKNSKCIDTRYPEPRPTPPPGTCSVGQQQIKVDNFSGTDAKVTGKATFGYKATGGIAQSFVDVSGTFETTYTGTISGPASSAAELCTAACKNYPWPGFGAQAVATCSFTSKVLVGYEAGMDFVGTGGSVKFEGGKTWKWTLTKTIPVAVGPNCPAKDIDTQKNEILTTLNQKQSCKKDLLEYFKLGNFLKKK